METFCIFV